MQDFFSKNNLEFISNFLVNNFKNLNYIHTEVLVDNYLSSSTYDFNNIESMSKFHNATNISIKFSFVFEEEVIFNYFIILKKTGDLLQVRLTDSNKEINDKISFKKLNEALCKSQNTLFKLFNQNNQYKMLNNITGF